MNSYVIAPNNDTFIHTHRCDDTTISSWSSHLGIYVKATLSRNETVQLFHQFRRDGIKLRKLAD
jgi:hypothetical protein